MKKLQAFSRVRLAAVACTAALIGGLGLTAAPATAVTAQMSQVPALASSPPVLSENYPVKKARYGLFVHYVPGLTVDKNGAVVADLNVLANGFDATDFANDLQAFGVDYVKFTAWHKGMFPLYPSTVMNQYRGSNASSQRDVIGEMINAVKAKGISVVLYTHPRDGHDMNHADQLATGWARPGTPYSADPNPLALDFQKWNNFVYASYDELLTRYASRIDGIYIDEGDANGQSQTVVDYDRLRTLIRGYSETLVLQHNFFGSIYTADVGDKEYARTEQFASTDGRTWPAYTDLSVSPTVTPTWWTSLPSTQNATIYAAADMYRYSVLQAAANLAGGGVSWAAGVYPGGGWESGVETAMTTVADWRAEVARSVKDTLPSRAWPVPDATTVGTLPWGGVALRSTDDHIDYIHVFDPPAGRTITLPAPTDGRQVASAVMLRSGAAATVQQNATSVSITLPGGESWHTLDTVIALNRQVTPPTALVSASSSVESGEWGVSRAIDGSATSRPGSMGHSSSASEWTDHSETYTIDLGTTQRVNHVTVLPRTDANNAGQGMPRAGQLQTSTNGSTWTTVHAFSNRPISSSAIDIRFTTRDARYIRVQAGSLWANPNDAGRFRLQFAEFGVRHDDPVGTDRRLTNRYHSRQLQGTGNAVPGSSTSRYTAAVPMRSSNAEAPWTIAESTAGTYVLTNQASGLRLEDSGAAYNGRSDVSVVVQSSATVSDAQRWRIEAAGTEGWLRFINVASGRALHATGNVYMGLIQVTHVVAVPATWLGTEQQWSIN